MTDKQAKTKLTMENVREAVEYWRSLNFNVIPFNSKDKTGKQNVDWGKYQPPNKISDDQYNKWYRNGTFIHGMAICCGQINEELYAVGVDCDNQTGIDLVLQALGYKTLQEASKHVIVVQHRDAKDRAHFIFYSNKELPSQNIYNPPTADQGPNTAVKEFPKAEIKGTGQVLIVPPSTHMQGFPYEIIRGSIREPEVINNAKGKFENAFKNYGIPYCNNGVVINDTGAEIGLNLNLNEEGKIPIEVLFNPDYKVYEGDRNNELIRVANSLLFRNQTILEEYKIQELFDEWNENHCVPPVEKKEKDNIWKSAKKFVDGINKQRAYERHLYQERLKREQEQDEFFASEQRKREQSKPLTIAELARLDQDEGKLHYVAGQLTSIGPLYKRVRSITTKCNSCGQTKTLTYPYPHPGKNFTDTHFDRLWPESCLYVFGGTCKGDIERIPEWISSVNIEVSDNNTLQDIDKLRCIIFGNDTRDVGIGENATLLGMIHNEAPSKSIDAVAVDYALSIKYESREQQELSSLDVQAIKRFRKKFSDDDELMNKFVSMTACHIIGLHNIKEGILYMVTNAKPDKPEMRQRLHGIIISPPALAKTALLRYATTLMTRSTFETCQTSTGLSLFAMVEKEGDMKIIRLGPIARSLFASTDEFNRTGNSDQEKYLGAMQEGFFTSNKFGKGKRIVCPVTILASINPPIGSKILISESGDQKVDLSEMNVIAPVMDRFDFKWYIIPLKDDEFDNLIDKKMEFVDHQAPDYSPFISKWIKYAKERYNPRLSEIARENLKLAVKDLRKDNKDLSPRVIETLANATKARARFLLKDTADVNDAAAIIKFYSIMIQGYNVNTIKPKDILDIGAEECYKVLAEVIVDQTIPYRFDYLLKKACSKSNQLSKYIMSGVAKDKYFDRSENKRARNVYERLLKNYPDIMIVSKNPTTLQLPTDKVQSGSVQSESTQSESDQSDFNPKNESDQKREHLSTKKAQFVQSDQSDQSDRDNDVGVNNQNQNQNQNQNTSSNNENDETKNNSGIGFNNESERSEGSDYSKKANFVRERYHSSPDQVQKQKSGQSDSGSKSIPINRKKSKYFTTSTAGTVESKHKYICPNPNCDYSDANPSRITEHIEQVHSSDSKGFGSGSSNGGLD